MIEVLAPAIVANFLLPYVKDGVEAIAKKVTSSAGEAAGEQAVSLTKQVWARVQKLFAANPEQEVVLKDFERDPDSTAAYLQMRLTRLLEDDSEAARELAALAATREQGSDRSIASVIGNSGVTITVTGTMHHSTITGQSFGDGNASVG